MLSGVRGSAHAYRCGIHDVPRFICCSLGLSFVDVIRQDSSAPDSYKIDSALQTKATLAKEAETPQAALLEQIGVQPRMQVSGTLEMCSGACPVLCQHEGHCSEGCSNTATPGKRMQENGLQHTMCLCPWNLCVTHSSHQHGPQAVGAHMAGFRPPSTEVERQGDQ